MLCALTQNENANDAERHNSHEQLASKKTITQRTSKSGDCATNALGVSLMAARDCAPNALVVAALMAAGNCATNALGVSLMAAGDGAPNALVVALMAVGVAKMALQ